MNRANPPVHEGDLGFRPTPCAIRSAEGVVRGSSPPGKRL